MGRRKRNESDVVKACCQYLQMKRHLFWRTNNIPVYDPKTGRHRAMPLYCIKGVGDILGLIKGIFYSIECKHGANKQSIHQKEFQRLVEENGGKYIVAKSVDDLISNGL